MVWMKLPMLLRVNVPLKSYPLQFLVTGTEIGCLDLKVSLLFIQLVLALLFTQIIIDL